MSELFKGTVKWFNDAKGFGFIEHESGKDIFIHYSVIESDGYKTLKDGEEVEYTLADGDKGLHAERVIRINVPKSEISSLANSVEVEVSESNKAENKEINSITLQESNDSDSETKSI